MDYGRSVCTLLYTHADHVVHYKEGQLPPGLDMALFMQIYVNYDIQQKDP